MYLFLWSIKLDHKGVINYILLLWGSSPLSIYIYIYKIETSDSTTIFRISIILYIKLKPLLASQFSTSALFKKNKNTKILIFFSLKPNIKKKKLLLSQTRFFAHLHSQFSLHNLEPPSILLSHNSMAPPSLAQLSSCNRPSLIISPTKYTLQNQYFFKTEFKETYI